MFLDVFSLEKDTNQNLAPVNHTTQLKNRDRRNVRESKEFNLGVRLVGLTYLL